jgi:hypothetical protein
VDDVFGLPELPLELKRFTGGKTVTYRMLYQSVLNGQVPATRSTGGRWVIYRRDLPEIAAALRLPVVADADAGR